MLLELCQMCYEIKGYPHKKCCPEYIDEEAVKRTWKPNWWVK